MAKQIVDLRCEKCHIVWRQWVSTNDIFYCPECGENFYPQNAAEHHMHADAASAATKPADTASALDTVKPAGSQAAPVM